MRFHYAAAILTLALAPHPEGTAEAAAPPAEAPAVPKASVRTSGCLPTGNGFLRAHIRGALNLDIDWQNPELECEGTARPDGFGIRLAFAGPIQTGGRRMRMVFGVATTGEGRSGSALPTNLTVIVEGEKRLFATLGEHRCTVDKLQQERFGPARDLARSYRVLASGFCIDPVPELNANDRIIISSFDFAGQVTYTVPPDTGSSTRGLPRQP